MCLTCVVLEWSYKEISIKLQPSRGRKGKLYDGFDFQEICKVHTISRYTYLSKRSQTPLDHTTNPALRHAFQKAVLRLAVDIYKAVVYGTRYTRHIYDLNQA